LGSKGNLTRPESVWVDGGGGPSFFEPEPGYQSSYGITSTNGQRGTPDVAYNADPNTAVAVYDSFPFYALPGIPGWTAVGGTSAGAPQWSGLIALADQGRAPLSTQNLFVSPIYNAATGSTTYASNFRDITTGSNGYAATKGYDLASGLGSPLANSLVPYLHSH
jgi:subtilase family serine protease